MMKLFRLTLTPALCFFAAIIAQGLNLINGAQPWLGEALLSATWVWTATYLCGSVFATLAAWDGARLFPRSEPVVWGRGDVRSAMIRRWWAWTTLAATAPTLITWAYMVTYISAVPGSVEISSLATVFAGIATVAALLGGGLILGRVLGKIYGPLAAFALSLLALLNSYLGSFPVLMIGGVNDSLLGLRLSEPAMITSVVGLTVLLLAEANCLFGPPAKSLRNGVIALATALLISLAPDLVSAPRFLPVEDLTDGVGCVKMGPDSRPPATGEVCINAQHNHKSDEVMAAWSTITMAVAEVGITDFPTLFYELPPAGEFKDVPEGPPGSVATYTLTGDQLDFRSGTIEVSRLINQITAPVWCPGLWGDESPSDQFFSLQESTAGALTTVVTSEDLAKRKEAAKRFRTGWDKLKRCEGL
ncbi:MAG: hypothetical protein Q4P15_10655 [Propionibacteriaceae bacterium]|nr:hypothetical protein [Propionibacteriaceae bacterium]